MSHCCYEQSKYCYWRDKILPDLQRKQDALVQLANNVVVYSYSDIAMDPAIWAELVSEARAILRDVEGK